MFCPADVSVDSTNFSCWPFHSRCAAIVMVWLVNPGHPTSSWPDDMLRVLMSLSHSVCLNVTVRLANARAPLGPVPKLNRYVPLVSGSEGGTGIDAGPPPPHPLASNDPARTGAKNPLRACVLCIVNLPVSWTAQNSILRKSHKVLLPCGVANRCRFCIPTPFETHATQGHLRS